MKKREINKKIGQLREAAARHITKNRMERALKCYEAILELNQHDLAIQLKRGDLLQRKGDTEQAMQAYCEVARAYAQRGDVIKAIVSCKKILEIDPEHSKTLDMLAELYAERHRASNPDENFELALGYSGMNSSMPLRRSHSSQRFPRKCS